ncbi:IS200/IS605 family transposase [Flammeovirga sp. SubArs3]|uniref:IS200/IS605 family transposase n=1 Tax=Flammeovirga sp. SubArs3 TaxID=2995316 RepID=UPI00248C7CD3|nr:IS200/IS605 family transposase [Flammeovirga sp. SubArs3]
MSHSNHHLWFHIVWTVKYRRPLFSKKYWQEHLGFIIRSTSKKNGITKCYVNGYKDHVHILIRIFPTQNISSVVKKIKGVSSRIINQQKHFSEPFEWQEGYFVTTVSPSNIYRVIGYIQTQWEKHERLDFNEEMNQIESLVEATYQPRN